MQDMNIGCSIIYYMENHIYKYHKGKYTINRIPFNN